MSSLAEHITVLEIELAQMTRDGHHHDEGTRQAMTKIDSACYLLHKRKREMASLNLGDTDGNH
jgi:hypothetical protein